MSQSFLIPLLCVALAGCATNTPSNQAVVTGESSYLERIAVPHGTRFEAVLEDVSLADAAAVRIGQSVIENAGQPPYRFSIAYDPSQIIANHSYAVRTSLRIDDRLLFISTTNTPVITRDNPVDVRILMQKISSPNMP